MTQEQVRSNASVVATPRSGLETSATSGAGWIRAAAGGPLPQSVFAMLRSAIGNVVRNALAYSPPEMPVRIRIECVNRLARGRVRDRGSGIPPEEQVHVFEPFSSGRASGDMRSSSGLGLFITRRVLEAHGGSISLRPSKQRSTFVLELPADGLQLCAS
jgi:signal transduction histidine kinase